MRRGRSTILAAGLLGASASLFAAERWIVVRSPNFELYTTAGERAGRDTVRHFEQIRSFFLKTAVVKRQPSRRLLLVVFRSRGEFRLYRPTEFAGGFYARGPERDYIVLGPVGADVFRMATHEYFHWLVEHSGTKLPLWLNEGLAEVYSTLKPVGGQLSVGQLPPGRYEVARSRKLLDLATLISIVEPSHYPRDRGGVELFYAQCWALAHMLVLGPDYRPKMAEFLNALHSGATQPAAFRQAFGKSLDQVQRDLEAYLRRDSLFHAVFDVQLEKMAEHPEVRPADRLEAELLLAGLLTAVRKPDEAEQAYTRLAREFPQRYEVPEALGYMALEEGSREKARAYFARAVELGSVNPRLYLDYGLLLEAESGGRSEAIPLLEKAVALDPDSVDARYHLGVSLIAEGRYREALSHLNQIRQVSAERAYGLFRALAFVHHQLAEFQAARTAAERARQHARSPEEISSAEEFLRYLNTAAEAGPGPALPAPGPGLDPPEDRRPNLARRPDEPGSQTPPGAVREPPAEVARGTFLHFDCLGQTARVRILSDGKELAFAILDPERVIIRGANRGTVDFTCGPQKPRPIGVEYYRQEDPKLGTAGVVVALEFL